MRKHSLLRNEYKPASEQKPARPAELIHIAARTPLALLLEPLEATPIPNLNAELIMEGFDSNLSSASESNNARTGTPFVKRESSNTRILGWGFGNPVPRCYRQLRTPSWSPITPPSSKGEPSDSSEIRGVDIPISRFRQVRTPSYSPITPPTVSFDLHRRLRTPSWSPITPPPQQQQERDPSTPSSLPVNHGLPDYTDSLLQEHHRNLFGNWRWPLRQENRMVSCKRGFWSVVM